MKIRFDGTSTVTFSGIEIEAKSGQEAEEKFHKMSIDEIISKGCIEDTKNDIDFLWRVSSTKVVRVRDLSFEPNSDLSEEEFSELPKRINLTIDNIEPEAFITGLIDSQLFEMFECKPASYTYEVVAEY